MELKSNNLNTFRILYLIKGILTLFFSVFFILYGAMGFVFNNIIESQDVNNEIPFNFGWIFIIVAGIGLVMCVALGILTLMAAKYLKEVKNYNFIFAIAIVNCLTGILGILLAVFSLIELSKPEVKALFNKE
ncbi:hypothetical protein [Seonamhaeicola maritimus]|uniref:DUF4064 domain-containing protein n=1 Tax=Seonamhaeicola maritimus TaxID=2591822 RepID=A0A5C7GF44_9FLAO|nr:hypothetical protein [Seonamhaeicola maritimus]TXG35670.1 hypothetical protein FUA22_14285 [Seonamhaeicola maritimus]